MFGGRLSDHSPTNQLWLFSYGNRSWSLIESKDSWLPPNLYDHTLTEADDGFIYTFGGTTDHGEVTASFFRINSTDLRHLEPLEIFGISRDFLRLSGHSTVFYEATRSLMVYGGITPDVSRKEAYCKIPGLRTNDDETTINLSNRVNMSKVCS